MYLRHVLFAVLLAGIPGVGCGPGPLPASAVCSVDADCMTGLKCLSFGISNNGTCAASMSKQCSIPCANDADCASLKGVNNTGTFKCFACPPVPSICGQVVM